MRENFYLGQPGMVNKKGERSKIQIDRGWPYQAELRADRCAGMQYDEVRGSKRNSPKLRARRNVSCGYLAIRQRFNKLRK
jgi:hypothetical protein